MGDIGYIHTQCDINSFKTGNFKPNSNIIDLFVGCNFYSIFANFHCNTSHTGWKISFLLTLITCTIAAV